jgi:hypothetical protein
MIKYCKASYSLYDVRIIVIIIIIIIIIMKSSSDRDNNYFHYVIQRKAGRLRNYAYYHPAGLDVIMMVYHLLYELFVFVFGLFLVSVGGLGWWAGGIE